MDPQPMPALLALENRLYDALQAAQAAHDETVATMDASRQTIDALLQNEATETAIYVDDTQLEMRALRDVVQREMDRARRDVAAFLDAAKLNVTYARTTRDRTRAAMQAKLQSLVKEREERRREWEREIARVQRDANDDIALLQDRTAVTSVPAIATITAKDEPMWPLLFMMLLVLGACTWLGFSIVSRRRTTATRVLYSEPLQNDCANGNKKPTRRLPKQATDSLRPSLAEPESTLYQRLRPGPPWSPAASTASTVSTPSTPTAT